MRSNIYILAIMLLAGCSSMTSTYMGESKPGTQFDGMPVVVQRPKYLKVTHKQVTYVLVAKSTTLAGSNTSAMVTSLGEPKTVDQIETEVVTVGEVFGLDLKRPVAGTTDFAIEFEANSQYPKKVGAKVDDKTLDSVSNALGTILEKGTQVFKQAAAKTSDVPAESIKISETVVRIELRSLDDPKQVYVIFNK